MDYELPTEFDIIVVGTGVVESVVSAAASRIGKRVLHVDSNNYYGGHWASFNLDSILKLQATTVTQESPESSSLLSSGEKLFPVGNNFFDLKDFSVEWHIPEKLEDQIEEQKEGNTDVKTNEVTWTQEILLKDSRKFNLDLTPKLQFARGDFVELLISSNIARYSEYRSVSRVLTWLNDDLEVVPCSRSDVFANNKVSVIEKRMLMKLFTSLDEEEKGHNEYENKTFRSFLKEKKLTPNLIHYVLYAISMSTDETSCIAGIKNTKRFLDSLGRFGKTPFLFSMYGSGEITQAFCRLSAVFGAVYALNQPLKGLIFEDTKFKGLICGNQRISAENLVIEAGKCPSDFTKENKPTSYISRAILVINASIMNSEKEHLTLLLYPPENGKNSCVIIELGSLTGTCPKDLYVVHLISRQSTNPREDFKHCVDSLFQKQGKPQILFSCYFSIPDCNDLNLQQNAPENVFICPGPDLDLDYDFSVKKAKDIFSSIYSDSEFLPRAPDPEEIIIEGDEVENEKVENLVETSLEASDKAANTDRCETSAKAERSDRCGTKSEVTTKE